MAAEAGDWCLIESDPGVFTELIRGFGVKGAQVEELYSLDLELFEKIKPVHGLIFLFKWNDDNIKGENEKVVNDDKIFFAKQVIKNACATQAIINLLLNINHEHVKIGSVLSDFKEFCGDFSSETRGLTLSNSEQIRTVHNSFSRQQMYEIDQRDAKGKAEDQYHFICYVPVNGRVYEIDGLKEGPVDHGEIGENCNDWTQIVRPVIEKRMQKYATGEIHFNLLAIVSDMIMKYETNLEQLNKQKIDGATSDQIELDILDLHTKISDEEAKMMTYKKENIRRRHNFLPLIVELLKALAKEGKLIDVVDKAKERSKYLSSLHKK